MTRTNLITGFLGSGKTTSILHLLAQKPADEKWAVLVNEFGEVGIDGALLADSGALLKEIPGGCMCCVNGLPMQVGLNTLLRQGKPDRLLIEPTGLGHPKQILDILTAAVYEPWIDLRATLCILDPRQLLDERAVSNDNFRDQLAAADIIVANKSDRETAESARALADELAASLTPNVVVTGLQLDKYIACAGAGRDRFVVKKLHIARSFPGTGDLYGAVLIGSLIQGNALSAAADNAAEFVSLAIQNTPAGQDTRFGVWFEPLLPRLCPMGEE